MSKSETYWARHLQAIEALGVSTKAYAKEHGLPVQQLYNWRSLLKRQFNETTTGTFQRSSFSSQFMAVTVAQDTHNNSVCTLHLANGIRLEMAQLPKACWLGELLAIAGDR